MAYYWLRLKRDFFKRHDVRIVESMKNGNNYVLFYLKLLCESVDHEGSLRFSKEIPYTEDMLAVITGTDPEVVKEALAIFTQLGMVETLDDGTYIMTQIDGMIGSASQDDEARESTRKRVQKHREKKKQEELKRYSNVTCNGELDIDIDTDIELDTDIDIERDKREGSDEPQPQKEQKHKYGEYNNVLLSDSEMEKLRAEYSDLDERIERLSSYMASTGKKYKSHYATIRNWARKDAEKKETKKSSGAEELDEYYNMVSDWVNKE